MRRVLTEFKDVEHLLLSLLYGTGMRLLGRGCGCGSKTSTRETREAGRSADTISMSGGFREPSGQRP